MPACNFSVFLSTGIFAYLNYHVPRTRREILEILIKGLQRLEYRGYDSAGKIKTKTDISFYLYSVLQCLLTSIFGNFIRIE